MIYKSFVCVAAILIANESVFAQNMRGQLVWSSKGVNMLTISELKITKFSTIHHFDPLFAMDTALFRQRNNSKPIFYPLFPTRLAGNQNLPVNFFYLKLGWVCRQEWRFEKYSGIPLRIRLGSKEQVDFLEGK